MLKTDCKHFPGDRPCAYHKNEGIKCDNCNYYQPIAFKILIIKLDAVGDVLRTTSILPPLKKKYPDSYIVWCTRKNSKSLFRNNFFVDDVIVIDDDARYRIQAEEFDIVINLDTSKMSSAIASDAKGKNKIGFVLNKKGYVEAASEASKYWLEMSAFDDVKKANLKSYQQIMYEILELESNVSRPIIKLSDSDIKKISEKDFVKRINHNKPVIGLNIGVGTKWPSKGWALKKWKEFVEKPDSDKYNFLLLGGSDEKVIIDSLSNEYYYLINTGCENTLTEFAAIVNLCDLIITADTLALHIATALEKKIIALFGPSSANEIELYGNGVKLFSEDECKCYYKKYCTEKISCMEKISPEMVIKSVSELLAK
jgi:heptosyltransferase-2